MSELFNGTIQTTIAGDEIIAFGKPGELGAKNITFANLAAAISGSSPLNATFVNGDLDSGNNYRLIINHNRNTKNIGVALWDDNDILQDPAELVSLPAAPDDVNNVIFTMNAPITGTWRYTLLFFQS